jgi:chemotaxis signal transduction protein
MTTDTSRTMSAYCLFSCRARRLAVGVDAVEAVMEAGRVVRLPLAPRPVAGLCLYRGAILPVVDPADGPAGPDADREGCHPAVLVLRAGRGPLGLLTDRGALAIVETPRHAADGAGPLPEGLVAAGAIERDGRTYAVLDIDRSWKALRDGIEVVYGAGRRPSSFGEGGLS